MRRASGIDGGNALASAMVGVDFDRSGAVSQAGDPVPFPERVSAFPSSGKGTELDARNRQGTAFVVRPNALRSKPFRASTGIINGPSTPDPAAP
jgi:hypothetical protein